MVKMIPSFWHLATILVFVLFVSSSVVVTDTPASCDSNDQHCLTANHKTDPSTIQQKNLHREQQDIHDTRREIRAESLKDTVRAERDTATDHWDQSRRQSKLVNKDSQSQRLYDRIRDVKKSASDQEDTKRAEEPRRYLTGSRRYLESERYADLDSSEIEKLQQGTLRERLLHKFALSATEDGYNTARAQRRLSRLRDDIQTARYTSRFERLQQDRIKNLNRKDDENYGDRTISRFERNRNDRLARTSLGDVNPRAVAETGRLLPRHFRNVDKIRENLDRRESAFERRSAYTAIIRNQVRVTDDINAKDNKQRIQPRYEIQRKHRQELEAALKKEQIEGTKDNDDTKNDFMQNREMRKEQRRLMEERMVEEEKQRIFEEEKQIREEAKRVRERKQKILDTEREVKEVIRQIKENERKAREERQRKLDEEKRQKQSNVIREDERQIKQREQFNVHDNEQRVYDDKTQHTKNENERIDHHYENEYYDEGHKMFDHQESDENGWDYSDYSDSNSESLESYEDDWDLQRRLREDIRHFPDIKRQIRENVQMYGREYLDAREVFSGEIEDFDDSEHRVSDENRKTADETNSRSKRSIKDRSMHTDRRFDDLSERRVNGKRQIAERRSFRSQDERLIRRINLRQMNQERQFDNERSRERFVDNDVKIRNNRRMELERNDERRQNNQRIEDIRSRRTQRNERIEVNSERRQDNRRTEDIRSRRIERVVPDNDRRQDNYRVEDIRSRRTERTEANSERREDNRRFEDIHDRRSERIETNGARQQDDRRIEDIRGRIVERIETDGIRKQNDQRIETVRNGERRITENLMLDSPINEDLFELKKNEKMFEKFSAPHLLQASLLGIILLKIIMNHESLEKKFHSNPLLKKLGSMFSNVIVF